MFDDYYRLRATYSPEDNKLRLHSGAKLDPATYERAKIFGFKWAPKQGFFVAPMWTPAREDFLLELVDEIEDEDTTLAERAEARADRFHEFSEKRAADASDAFDSFRTIAENIPLGQPILVGHHSERRARKDAEKIENRMSHAIKMWDTAEYWKRRAAGALKNAKYKELPAVRHRRIKGLEADKRKQERSKKEAETWLKMWLECETEQNAELQKNIALRIANMCGLHLPRKDGDREDFTTSPTAHDALLNTYPNLYAPRTLAEVIEAAKKTYPATIAHCARWISHFENRIIYERAMLDESGGIAAAQIKPEVGGAISSLWAPKGGWAYIQKVNKVTVTILHRWSEGGRVFRHNEPLDKIHGIMSKAQVDKAREEKRIIEIDERGFYLIDSNPDEPTTPKESLEEDSITAAQFDALREQLKAGVQAVNAPQLFPTPPDLAAHVVELADIKPGMRILEPSAGTGRLISAALDFIDPSRVSAVEINLSLANALASRFQGMAVYPGDFLGKTEFELMGPFDRIIMNPPFTNGCDIQHINHALTMLKTGGRLVAICANGPRQREQLKHVAESSGGWWEDLPAGSFTSSGTNVNSALVVIER